MPELPEVETVRQQLEAVALNQEIENVEIRYSKIIHSDLELFILCCKGAKFNSVERTGKFLLLNLNNGYTIISHLRMEGKYYYETKPNVTKHDHILFFFEGNSALKYNDTRKFGTMELVKTSEIYNTKSILKLGYEPFDINDEFFFGLCQKSAKPIKLFILDQSKIAGIGNIYADEILFSCKIHPLQRTNTLTKLQTDLLISNAIKILKDAIQAGGASVRSYKSLNAIDGKFQLQLNAYQQNGSPCHRCQTIIEKIKLGGRGTCYCPKCQQIKQ